MKYTLICLVALSLFVSTNGLGIPQFPATTDYWTNYPTSFPWENEASIPQAPDGWDNPIDVMNEETLDTMGGYTVQGLYFCNLFAYTPYGMPAGKGYCGTNLFYFVYKNFQMEPGYLSPFNCTAASYIFEGPLKGTLGSGPSVCDTDKCCSEYFGRHFPAKDWPSLQEKWDTRYNKYYCDWYTHEFYCSLLLWQVAWCIDHYNGDALARKNMQACWNAQVAFFEGCKTFKQVGPSSILIATPIEPEIFVKTQTAQQMNSALGLFWTNDRVCLPACHYDPILCKAEDAAPAAPAAEGDPAPAAADPAPAAGDPAPASSASDSAAAAQSAPVMLFAAMASFFAFSRYL